MRQRKIATLTAYRPPILASTLTAEKNISKLDENCAYYKLKIITCMTINGFLRHLS
jgi:hypothetical protein